MADDQSTDLLMMIVQLDGSPVESDCQTDFNTASKSDPRNLMRDFIPAAEDGLANFFEIEDVDLGFNMRKSGKSNSGTSYALDMGEITVDRKIDRASTILMNSVWTSQPFLKASIVKRRATGRGINTSSQNDTGAQSGEAYIRLDFDGVLITKVDWNDGHAVKEKITFITRGLKMQYRAQEASGRLMPPIPGEWKMQQ